ncbi:hypothetical protein ACP4OV_030279 [Aristida adscensionis]
MARLPLFSVLFFLVSVHVHVPASHGTLIPTYYDRSICSESFMCGGVDIHYPFFLFYEIGLKNTAYSCGYTDLNISCQAGVTPTIRLGDDDYTITSISYDTNTILLADADVPTGGGDSCPRVSRNVSFGTEWLHYTSSQDNLTFINCSPAPGGGVSLVLASDELDKVADEHDLAEHCREVFAVPVLRDSVARGGVRSALPREYGAVLAQGFELAWRRRTTDPCYLCEKPNSGGHCSYSQSKEFLGCLCPDGKVGGQDCTSSGANIASASRHGERTTIYIVTGVSSFLLLCLITLALFCICKHGFLHFKSKDEPSIESFLQKNENLHPKRYTYADVKRMTKSFAVKLGQGGFGAVYRGSLSDGRHVAVKILKDTKGDGEEFMNEVASISRTSHVNVVTLLGFCLQGSKRALIYEYMPNGSLERYAFNGSLKRENTLTWEKLFDIAIGIARGLEYLHRGCNTRIVHFDIKPHNILLDQDFCPKISDFGLAKLCLNKESAISIVGARGTIGYIAPEVYSKQFGTVSSKSDVYSYGMMVLEMVGARDKNINATSESSSQYFPQWIYEHLDEYCISASEINGETTELVRKMIVIGLWCIQVSPTERPTMTRVVEMLEGSTSNLELPPKIS